MFGLGFSEILVLGVIALIVIGPEDLPKVARTIGRFMNELKRGGESFKREFEAGAKSVQDDLKIDPFAAPKPQDKVAAKAADEDFDQVHAPSPPAEDEKPFEVCASGTDKKADKKQDEGHG